MIKIVSKNLIKEGEVEHFLESAKWRLNPPLKKDASAIH